jgi:hypothetical protein
VAVWRYFIQAVSIMKGAITGRCIRRTCSHFNLATSFTLTLTDLASHGWGKGRMHDAVQGNQFIVPEIILVFTLKPMKRTKTLWMN